MNKSVSIAFQGHEIFESTVQNPKILSLVWIQTHSCGLTIAGEECFYTPNTILCLPSTDLNLGNLEEDTITIYFPSIFISTLQLEMLMPRQPNSAPTINPEGLHCPVSPLIEYLLRSIVEEYNSDIGFYKEEVLQALIKLVVLEIIRQYTDNLFNNSFSSDDVRLVNHFLDLVCQNFLELKKVADYADKLCISPNYLNIKVKRISGYTASHHIQQCILQEAILKARHDGMGLKQVAYYLGYEDTTYFSKFFKKLTGQSYSKFRKELTPNLTVNY